LPTGALLVVSCTLVSGVVIGGAISEYSNRKAVDQKWQDELVSRGLAEWKLEVGREVTSSFNWLPKPEPVIHTVVRTVEVPAQCTRKHEPEKFYLDPGFGGTNYWYTPTITNIWVQPYWTNSIIYN